MRKYLVTLILPVAAWAHGDHDHSAHKLTYVATKPVVTSPSGFGCEEILAAPAGAKSVAELVKMFGEFKTLEARAGTSGGDRLIMNAFDAAVANWVKVIEQNAPSTAYQKQMHAAVRAALTKHFPNVWNRKVKSQKDMSRLFKILEAIAATDPARPEFGLFKIQRLIQQRYDLKQYIDCR